MSTVMCTHTKFGERRLRALTFLGRVEALLALRQPVQGGVDGGGAVAVAVDGSYCLKERQFRQRRNCF